MDIAQIVFGAIKIDFQAQFASKIKLQFSILVLHLPCKQFINTEIEEIIKIGI